MKITDIGEGELNGVHWVFKLLAEMCLSTSVEHGFNEIDTYLENATAIPPEIRERLKLAIKAERIALSHSELSEALEGIRKPERRTARIESGTGEIDHTTILPRRDEHCPAYTSEEIELADVLIRIFHYAATYQLRLSDALIAKMLYNDGREFMHGKAL